jgi:transglutaminase-like putative cysteine protease
MKYQFAILSVIFAFAFTKSIGQKVVNLEEYKSKYPDKQAIMLVKKEEVRLTIGKHDSVDVTVNYYSEMLHLGERTEGLAESSVSFSDFIQLSDLEAKTMVPNKSSYKTVKVNQFQDKSSSSSGIFFDDNKTKVFNYPGVVPGAKTILSYTQKYKEPHLLSPYYFSSYVPVLQSELTLYVDKRLKIGYRMMNKDNRIQFTESVEGNFIVYKWTAQNFPEYFSESNAPSISYHEPHLIYFIEEVNAKNKKEIIFKDISDLYRWYYFMAIKNQKPVEGELKGIIDSLTKDTENPYEKTKRIFYWVQDHVKYVAFEEGYGGFIPRDANLVCDRRYGDCKDMANLLVQMLNAAGLKAYHTWIGTRDIPYSYNEVPAPNVDNHMIASVKIDDMYLFLDATGKYTKLGIPSSMIQGKEALLGIDENHYEIIKVPVVDANRNIVTDSTNCSIENNVLKGKGRIDVNGYNKIDFTYVFNYSKKENKKEYIKEYCTKGNNKFILKDYTIKNIEEKELPIVINYDYAVEDYIKSSGNELFINLNLDRTHDKSKIDTTKRKLPFEYDYKYSLVDVITLDIPVGYLVDYLPSDVKLSNGFFDFEISYKLDKAKNCIVYQKKSVLNTLMIERKDFNEWNKVANKVSQAYREVVVLKKK